MEIIIDVNGKTKATIDSKDIKSKNDLKIEWLKALNQTNNVKGVLDLVAKLDNSTKNTQD